MRRLLLSNDDGVHAPGLKALYDALTKHANLRVVAPDRDRSGASNSLTLSRPLAMTALDSGFYSVDGTPADCVYLGVNGIWDEKPDLVISGINHGGNLGDDVLYSGTVAAAMEGRNLGMSAIAMSLCGQTHFATAGHLAASLVGAVDQLSLPPRTLLNVNVPDVPWSEVKGVKVTRLGYRGPAEQPLAVQDPRGRTRYWIAPVAANADDGEDTDFAAVEAGFVSITPLQTDLTRHQALNDVRDWLDAFA
ncbi:MULTISPECIES: 5'/3'-nucleotidase SurE [unclassified Halomonas]|uniref:5'/3'-nucleotidase SurE n=1 Tax=unclassified Halomonas TaxID=2609666 RepID=UPI0006D99585|nr:MULTISPECIES: 5'/3'-nucleotidase SurE [unclassified Halomonas]KPQ20754.1 MAG: 5'-nucleotidase SurE [Halomonas sp. HL-93]SBR46751.1 5'-nucleotidase /3'-nucleotidase /exopolyphosphatase [Halomonas sp. HL-93]SNY98898.1 5'-nucleotidase /3'-nucleotidase /exopolyphosphatase [Halomonas sp. hl-4]